MQPGRNHLVVGAPPVCNGPSDLNTGMAGTLTTGEQFFCARTMRNAMCILLHLIMVQHILTNADHVGLWEVFVRITAFWLNMTRGTFLRTRKWIRSDAIIVCVEGRVEELRVLEAYLPDLTGPGAPGWIEIIYLSSIIELLPAIDLRHYDNTPCKTEELQEQEATQQMYAGWQAWFASQYVCKKDGIEVDMKSEIFEVSQSYEDD